MSKISEKTIALAASFLLLLMGTAWYVILAVDPSPPATDDESAVVAHSSSSTVRSQGLFVHHDKPSITPHPMTPSEIAHATSEATPSSGPIMPASSQEYLNPGVSRSIPSPNAEAPAASESSSRLIRENPTAPGNCLLVKGHSVRIDYQQKTPLSQDLAISVSSEIPTQKSLVPGSESIQAFSTPGSASTSAPRVRATPDPAELFKAKWGWRVFEEAQRAANGTTSGSP